MVARAASCANVDPPKVVNDELVMVNDKGVWVLNSQTGVFYNATNGPFYGLR